MRGAHSRLHIQYGVSHCLVDAGGDEQGNRLLLAHVVSLPRAFDESEADEQPAIVVALGVDANPVRLGEAFRGPGGMQQIRGLWRDLEQETPPFRHESGSSCREDLIALEHPHPGTAQT